MLLAFQVRAGKQLQLTCFHHLKWTLAGVAKTPFLCMCSIVKEQMGGGHCSDPALHQQVALLPTLLVVSTVKLDLLGGF